MSENLFHPRTRTDRLLLCVEVGSVLIIACGILLAVGYEIYWVASSGTGSRQCRIASVLKILNENWKVGLLVLIPLFYRTVRTFLELVKKGPLGIEMPQMSGEPEKEPNPQRGNR